MVAHVIKRTGTREPFVESKLHESVFNACMSVRALEGEASLLASRITTHVNDWIHDKVEVTTRDVHELAHTRLFELHSEAAYAYDTFDSVL